MSTTGYHVRELTRADRSAAYTLLQGALAGSSLGDRLRETVETAATGATREAQGLIAERGDRIVGVVLFGDYAGTVGGARLYAAAFADADDAPLARRLFDDACACVAQRGARYLLTELPDEPPLAPLIAALGAAGFSEVARVPDLVRDSVALLILRRDLPT